MQDFMYLKVRTSAQLVVTRYKLFKRQSLNRLVILIKNFKNILVTTLHAKEKNRAILPCVFHMSFTVRTLTDVASRTSLMNSLSRRFLYQVVLTIKNNCCRLPQVPVIVAVGVGLPLTEKINSAGVWLCAQNCDPIVDRVIESVTAKKMIPLDIVR